MSLLAIGLLFFLDKKYLKSGAFLALAVGVKIFYALPLLFAFKNKKFIKKKFICAAVAVSIIIHLPFIIDNFQAMYKSIVLINAGGEVFGQFQRFTLTFATFLDRQFKYYPPQIIFPIIVIGVYLFYWVTIKQSLNFAKTLALVSFVFTSSIFLAPIANASYYFTGSNIILLAIALSGNKSTNNE